MTVATRTGVGLALLLVCAAAAAGNKVYRWTDEQGRVHYGDRVPAGVSATRLRDLPTSEPENFAELQVQREGNLAHVFVRNRIRGPVQVALELTAASNVVAEPALPLRRLLSAGQRVQLGVIRPANAGAQSGFELRMQALPGDPQAQPRDVVYSLPVDESAWRLGQGFHGSFSHDDEQNRYAIDLIVAEGTPVLAARDGVVIQTEGSYSQAGSNREKFAGRANLIRILHDDGSMALYAHLREDGALVQPGQKVALGQLIGYTGNTGFSSGPHLHFAVQANTDMRLVSLPFRMVGPQGFLRLGTK